MLPCPANSKMPSPLSSTTWKAVVLSTLYELKMIQLECINNSIFHFLYSYVPEAFRTHPCLADLWNKCSFHRQGGMCRVYLLLFSFSQWVELTDCWVKLLQYFCRLLRHFSLSFGLSPCTTNYKYYYLAIYISDTGS